MRPAVAEDGRQGVVHRMHQHRAAEADDRRGNLQRTSSCASVAMPKPSPVHAVNVQCERPSSTVRRKSRNDKAAEAARRELVGDVEDVLGEREAEPDDAAVDRAVERAVELAQAERARERDERDAEALEALLEHRREDGRADDVDVLRRRIEARPS